MDDVKIIKRDVHTIDKSMFVGKTFNGIKKSESVVTLTIDDELYNITPRLNENELAKIKIKYVIPKFLTVDDFIGSEIISMEEKYYLRSMILIEIKTTIHIIKVIIYCDKYAHNDYDIIPI